MARAGYTAALAELVERGDQSPARLIAETIVSVQKDTKDAQADFDGADSLTGLTTLEEGGVRITGSSVTAAEHASSDSDGITELTGPEGDAIAAPVIEWSDEDEQREIHSLEARLNPNVSGAGVEVTTWVAQLFRLERVSMEPSPAGGGARKQVWWAAPISGQVRVSAVAIESTVEFVFTTEGESPRVGGAPIVEEPEAGLPSPTRPTTIAVVWALKAEGEIAGNVAWRTSAAVYSTVSNGHLCSRYDFDRVAEGRIEIGDRWFNQGNVSGLPQFALKGKTFTSKTITWTVEPLDLGAAPSSPVEMVLEGETPGDSALTAEVYAGGSWYEFRDGDIVGQDNTATGGSDLSAVTPAQTLDVRVTLDPSSSASTTPTLRRVGMEELESEVLPELVVVRGYSVTTDPVTLASSIPTAEATLYKSGVRDYRDFATELLSSTFPEDLLLRFWWGHPTLIDRKDWLHLEDFRIREVYPADGEIRVELVHPLEVLRKRIPPRDTVNQEREPVVYEAQTLKAVFEDLIDGQLGLAARLRGPGITDASTLVGKELKDRVPGVEELDRLHYLDGSTGIASQGRYKTRPMFDSSAPRAIFSPGEIDLESLSAGYASRITDFSVLFGWDERKDAGRGAWAGEVYASHAQAIARLGRAHLDQEADELDEETAKWIPSDGGDPPASSLATTIASRTIQHHAGGTPIWSWATTGHPRPWLELGDRVAVPTDLFVGLDPTGDGRPIRGPVWAILRIVGVHNLEGTRFSGWLQDFADILPSSIDLEHLGFADPKLEEWKAIFSPDGALSIRGTLSSDAKSFRAISDATAFQVRAVVAGEAIQTPDAEGYFEYELDGAGTWDFDDDAYISLVAYEKADGSGAESERVYQLRATRDPTQLDGRIWVTIDTANETLDVYATAEGPTSLFPADLSLWQDDPTGAVLQAHTFAASGDTIGPTGSGSTAEYAALTDLPLPKKGTLRFWGTLTSSSGAVTPLFSMGDLDSLPGGACTVADDYTANPTFRIPYDDDVAEIVIECPGSKTKTFTGLSGGGLETYTIGDTLDDMTTEADLDDGETRTGYTVTLYAAAGASGLSLQVFDGDLHGTNAAEPNRLTITGAQWYVSGTILSFKLYGWTVNVSPGPSTQSMEVSYNDGTGAVSYTYDFTGPGIHVLRASDGTTPYIAGNDQGAFDVTYTPYTGTGGTGTAGAPVTLNTGGSDESGAGTSGEARDGTVISGHFVAVRSTFDFQGRAADDEPELTLNASYNAGSQSGSWTPNMDNGGSQYVTASGTLTINAPSNLASGESMLLRVVTGGNTVTFSGVEGPRLAWDAGTVWVTFHSFGGTVALLGAAG